MPTSSDKMQRQYKLYMLTGADPVRGGGLKIIAPSGASREYFWGISCEKSRFYAKKSYFFPILGGARRVRPSPLDPPLVKISNKVRKSQLNTHIIRETQNTYVMVQYTEHNPDRQQ